MLGDASTIGTLTLSFVALSFACLQPRRGTIFSSGVRLSLFALGLALAALSVLARGVALGVAVPLLSVGIAALSADARISNVPAWRDLSRALSWLLVVAGVGAAGLAIWISERVVPQRGLLLVLQGMTFTSPNRMATFDSTLTQIGHGLFPWSALLPFSLLALFRHSRKAGIAREIRAPLVALVLLVFLSLAFHAWVAALGNLMPFPALAALAAIVGIWLDHINTDRLAMRGIFIGVAALEVVLLADFENLPDKVMAAVAVADVHVPNSFRRENLTWLRGSAIMVGLSFFAAGMGFEVVSRPPRSVREVLGTWVSRLRSAWGGHLPFLLLLAETASITGSALVILTRLGAPFQKIRLLSPLQMEVVTWAWSLLPGAALSALCCVLAYEQVIRWHYLDRELVQPRVAASATNRSSVMAGLVRRVRALGRARSPVLAGGLCAAAMLLSVGWASRLGRQLSPRGALSQFDALAKPGEPLGLLGVRPQIVNYYSSQRPEVLLDAEEAADWLQNNTGASSRWLIVKGDQFARLNAAYRERCHCFRNVPVIDGRSSEMLLVSNRKVPGIVGVNPLDSVVLEREPSPQQKLDADFGGQLQVLGWEIVSDRGDMVAEIKVGRHYKLRLCYRVLAQPQFDWETFVHIDGYGRRYNGDHETTQGQYPMSNWRPGDIIADEQTILLDPSFSSGDYELYFGFFKGGRRLEIRRGRSDDNRLMAGTLRVK